MFLLSYKIKNIKQIRNYGSIICFWKIYEQFKHVLWWHQFSCYHVSVFVKTFVSDLFAQCTRPEIVQFIEIIELLNKFNMSFNLLNYWINKFNKLNEILNLFNIPISSMNWIIYWKNIQLFNKLNSQVYVLNKVQSFNILNPELNIIQ